MSDSNVPLPYQPTGQAGADQNYQGLTASQYGYASSLPGQVLPGVQGQVNSLVNNPYATGYQSAANAAGAAGTGIGNSDIASSGALTGAGNQALGAGNSILSAGFDPQGALYAQQFQQMQDQQNAQNSMNGVGGSPYAAGLNNQAGQNFNMNWINNQLGRENTALTGYDNANATAGSDFSNAASLGTQGMNTLTQAGQLPYDAFGTIGSNNINAYNALSDATGQAFAPGDSLMNSLASYLGLGQSATSIAQQGQNQQFNQDNSIWSGLGSLFGNLGETAMLAGGY